MGFNLKGNIASSKPTKSGFYLEKNKVTYLPLSIGDKNFGTVSYGAYRAVENNTLDSYAPINEEEKSVLEAYKKQAESYAFKTKYGDTIMSRIIQDGDKSIVVPGYYDGAILSQEQAEQRYKATGEHFGKFNTSDEAISYANRLNTGGLSALGVRKAKEIEPPKVTDYAKYAAGRAAGGFTGALIKPVELAGIAGNKTASFITSLGGLMPNKVSKFYDQEVKDILNKEWALTEQYHNNMDLHERKYALESDKKNFVGGLAESAGSVAGVFAFGGLGKFGSATKGANAAKNMTTAALKTQANATKLTKSMNMVKNGLKSFFTPQDVLFGSTAAMSSAQEAYEKTGNVNKSITYGLSSGMLEIATEKMFGGFAGTGIGDSVVKFATKYPVVNKILDVTGEAIEEGAVSLIDPFLRSATGIEGKIDMPSGKELGLSMLSGVLLSGIMGAATYPVKKSEYKKTAEALNSTLEAIKIAMPDADVPEALNVNKANEKTIKERQETIKKLGEEYKSRVEKFENATEEMLAEYRVQMREYQKSIVSESQINSETDATKKATLQALRTAQLDYAVDMQQTIDDLESVLTSGADKATVNRLFGVQTDESFVPTYIDEMSGELVSVQKNQDGSFTVKNAYGSAWNKNAETFEARYTQLTPEQQGVINTLKNETGSGTIKENDINGVNNNGDIREYDGIGEAQLRENEETGLYRRRNQGDIIDDQINSSSGERKVNSLDKRKYGDNRQNQRKIRHGYHGTSYDFTSADVTRITEQMSDAQRADVLRTKTVRISKFSAEIVKRFSEFDFSVLEKTFSKYAKPIIQQVAKDFHITESTYLNKDIDLEFEYSKSSLKESINKQKSRYDEFVKMLSVFPDVIKNAVGIEVHADKYYGTSRADANLEKMYVLASAFNDGNGIIPVKLEVKEFRDRPNKLYVAVSVSKKEAEIIAGNAAENQQSYPTYSASVISLADLVSIVNPDEGDFLKYFPDSMLDSEQIEGKNKALEKDAEKIESLIMPAVNKSISKSSGNMNDVQTMRPKVVEAIKKTMRPEIRTNSEAMAALRERFGNGGLNALAEDIILTVNRDGNIGAHEALFADNGKAIYDALGASRADDEPRFSIENDKFGNSYWRVESDKDVFKEILNRKDLQKAAYEYILRGDKGEVISEIIDGKPLNFTRISAKEYVYGREAKRLDAKDYDRKMRMAPSIADLIENASVEYNTPDHKNHKFAIDGFKNYRGRVRIDNTIFVYIVRVGVNDGQNMFYDINLEVESTLPGTNVRQGYNSDSTSNDNVPQNDNIVNTNIRENSENDTRESEVNSNEQGRSNSLSADGGWGYNGGAGEQVERVSGYERGNQGKNAAERQDFARELTERGQTEEVVEQIGKYNYKYAVVNPEAYNDDMLSMVEEAKSRGIELGFFVGNARVNYDSKRNFLINGIKISGSKVLVQYDADLSPQILAKHEIGHAKWLTAEMQKVKNDILNQLSDEDKQKILSQERYKRYMKVYKGNMNAVWEEFVCDVLAGMNDYAARFESVVNGYWYGKNSDVDIYSPAEYTESIDTGGRSVESESENADTLANKKSRENNDSIWQRSDDTKGVYHSVGNRKRSIRLGKGKGQGFVDWSRTLRTFNVNERGEKERAYGILREISGLKPADVDVLGNRVSDKIKSYFRETVFKNSKGELIPLYHATDGEFNVFENGDFGFHVGNVEQAIGLDKKYIKEVYVNITNPLYIQEDTMRWYGLVIANKALSQKIISLDEYNALAKLDGFDTYDYNSDANRAIREILKQKGYNGIIYNNGFEGEGISAIAFDSNQIKYTSNENPTSDSDLRLSLAGNNTEFWDEWLNKIEEHGVIPKGENPVRDIAVPKKIDKNRYVSRFARTMLEAGVTPPDMVGEFEKRILDGEMTHEVITNDRAREYATGRIKELGYDEARASWEVLAREGKIGKKELALGMELYNQAITNKDIPTAMKLAAELAAEATRAGQTLQACKMLKLMSPDGQLYYLEKSVQKMNEEFKAKLGDKFKNIELDEKLMEDFLNATDEESRNAAYDRICQSIADQIPATKLDKWNAWRYLAMLGNPRTHIRNIIGNGVFVPAVRIKNYVGAVMEIAAGVDESERTKSLRKSKAAVEFAKDDFEKMVKVLQGENAKYAVTSDIEGKRTIFKTKWLETLRTKNFDFLEKEDMWFLKLHYIDALARVITARKLDVNNLSTEALETARAYAIKEAQAATYRDANALAEGLNQLQKKIEYSDKKAVRATGVLLEGVMPFKKTPLNIAKQGIQYSPVGILTGVYKGLKRLKSGNAFSSAEIIDELAKGMTGTGIMLIGLFLTSIGALNGPGSEDKKKRAFDKMVGEQSYALKIGDKSYTIDWATPMSLPLFTGAELYRLASDSGFSFGQVVDAIVTLPEPLLELSVFSGISDVIESAQYSEVNPVFAISSDMITSYLLQACPTVGGQLSRIIDDNKREYYYTDKNSGIPRGIQSFIGQASSKIPFASFLFAPSVDEWGREESYGNIIERILENVASPGYYSDAEYTMVDKELKRLYEETGEASVLPTTQQKYYKENKITYNMSAADYAEVKKMRGQQSFKLLKELIGSKRYKEMSYTEKVKAIKKCYETAGEETKKKMLEKIKRNSKK